MLRDPPIDVQHTRLSLVFHRGYEADPGHAWLRRLILAIARDVAPAGLEAPIEPPLNFPTHERLRLIVIGAGSAGCVLANRLSADGATVAPDRGGRAGPPPLDPHPRRLRQDPTHPRLTWGYRTEPDAGTGNRRWDYPRGKVWGGSS